MPLDLRAPVGRTAHRPQRRQPVRVIGKLRHGIDEHTVRSGRSDRTGDPFDDMYIRVFLDDPQNSPATRPHLARLRCYSNHNICASAFESDKLHAVHAYLQYSVCLPTYLLYLSLKTMIDDAIGTAPPACPERLFQPENLNHLASFTKSRPCYSPAMRVHGLPPEAKTNSLAAFTRARAISIDRVFWPAWRL